MRRIREVSVARSSRGEEDVEYLAHPEWSEAYPWLVQGITTKRGGFDLRLFGPAESGVVMGRWEALRTATGFPRAVHARQVHGSSVVKHQQPRHAGLTILPDTDGHATSATELLLTVAVADCVPVFVVEPRARRIAMIHAGWRGLAGGILGQGLQAIDDLGGDRSEVRVHAGPHICDQCYEVGPEVHTALGFSAPPGPTPVSLARALADQAEALGVSGDRFTTSVFCTRCSRADGADFYSHRGGSTGRQVGLMGIRPS